MKREKISNAITNIDAKYIEEAAHYPQKVRKKFNLHSFFTIAACLCFTVGLFLLWSFSHIGHNDASKETEIEFKKSEEGIIIPQTKLELSSSNTNAESDMIAFFIYQGRSYEHYDWIEDGNNLVGEYLGTSTGLIDEWTSKDGYVDNAGSIAGDFYSVNGYDPTFMLCMEYENGTIQTFINNNGFTIKHGLELFEDRLHLSTDYVTVKYQTREDWYLSQGDPVLLDKQYEDVVKRFLDALNDSEFMLLSDIPLDEGETSVYDSKEIYHLFFTMENGMNIHLRLFEGGYVSFQGINRICVQVDAEIFQELIQTFES